MASSKATFECNDLKVIGDSIFVRRDPFETPNYRCGIRIVEYSKSLWDYTDTGKTCKTTSRKIYRMTRK